MSPADANDAAPLDAVLEPLAVEAWPAAEVEEREGWVLRATGGVTRRGNSVWTGRATGETPLTTRILAAERWYAARRLPPLFALPPRSAPPGLDAVLAARGYRVEAPVLVMATPEGALAPPGDAPGAGQAEGPVRVELHDAPGEAWTAEATASRGYDARGRRLYEELVARVPRPAAFALARVAGTPVGAGLGVVQGPWLGVFAVHTRPAERHRGVGAAVLRALRAFGAAEGATRAWLQVEEENAAGRTLFSRAGFREAYRLRYRRAPRR